MPIPYSKRKEYFRKRWLEKKPGVKRVNSSHLKKEPVFTPKTEPKINQILALIQQERIERILLRHEISESIRELKEQLTALKAPTHKETKRKNNLSAKTKAKIKQRKNTLSPESQEQLKNLTAGLVKYSKEWWKIYNQLPERKIKLKIYQQKKKRKKY